MAISFNRSRTQLLLENLIDPNYIPNNCTKQELKDFKEKARNYSLKAVDVVRLHDELIKDANDLLYSGCISFLEGISDMLNQCFSWACVKLYYSLFYLCRAQLAYNNYLIFRIGGELYSIEIKQQSQLINCKEKTTHKATFAEYKDKVSYSYILSNEIDGESAINWYMDLRETVNYRARGFYDPGHLSAFENFSTTTKFLNSLKILKNDVTGLMFQEDYAVIGIPRKLLADVIKINSISLSDIQKNYLNSLIKPGIMQQIF